MSNQETNISIVVFDSENNGKYITRELMRMFPNFTIQGFNLSEDLHAYRKSFRVDLILLHEIDSIIGEELLRNDYRGKIIVYGSSNDISGIAKSLNATIITQPATIQTMCKIIKSVLGINGDCSYITVNEFKKSTDDILEKIENVGNKFDLFKDHINTTINLIKERIDLVVSNGKDRDYEIKDLHNLITASNKSQEESIKESKREQDELTLKKESLMTDLKKTKIVSIQVIIVAIITMLATGGVLELISKIFK